MGTVCVTVCDADRGFVLFGGTLRGRYECAEDPSRGPGVEFCVHTFILLHRF